MPSYRISREFKAALKLHSEPSYRIAQNAGIDPATLSKIICGIVEIKPNDSRVLAVAKILGVPPSECFEEAR